MFILLHLLVMLYSTWANN